MRIISTICLLLISMTLFAQENGRIRLVCATPAGDPMIILDGVEIGKSKLSTIDAGTIRSINILKNKKATRSYGNKGMNGVIIINSKKKIVTAKKLALKKPIYQ